MSETYPMILIADPKVLAIPVIDNQEALIDIRQKNTLVYGESPEIPNNTDYTKMRATVYQKIQQAQALLPAGLRFCLYEAYRSLTLQKMLFDNRFEKISAVHSQWSQEQLFLETIKMASPVVNLDGTKNIPPHVTGAAIDIYLIDAEGSAVDMGIHPKDWMQDLEGLLSLTESPQISKQAKQNRAIMSQVLTAVGFVNYPSEFWHWSYGDRYWAYHQNQPHALYGII